MVEYQKQGSGPAFVYISGIEGTGKNFFKQADDLARDHTVLTLPLRPVGRYGMEALVDDLVHVIRDAGFERATVLGESFGGLMLMAAALERPRFIERMILVNTFASFPNRAKINLGVALCSVLPYSVLRAYRARTAPHNLFGDDVAEADRRTFLENSRGANLEGYFARMRIIRKTDLRPRLGEIKVPALVVAGTEDRVLNAVESAREIAAGLPRARLKVLEGAGHAALVSNRVRVRDWLAEFDEI